MNNERLDLLRIEYSVNNKEEFNSISLGSSKNFNWLCSKCFNTWIATFHNRYKNESNCPKCSIKNQALKRAENSINKNGSLLEYITEINDYWSSFNILNPNEISIKSKKQIILVCSKNHYWNVSPYKLENREFNDCPYCYDRKLLRGFNDCTVDCPEIFKYWDYDKNIDSPYNYFSGSSINKFFICSNGHSKFSAIRNRIRDNFSCRECNFRESSLERIVADYLTGELNLTIIRNRKLLIDGGKKLEIDIQLPDLKIAFEVQDFWTHNKTLNNAKFNYGGKELIKKGPKYHENKRLLSREQLNINLFDLWEDDIRSGEYINIINEILNNL